MSWDSLFGPITGKKNPRRTLKNAEWRTLEEDTFFDGMAYAKGSQYKVWETDNFGWVCFHHDSRTPDGNKPGRFLHKY